MSARSLIGVTAWRNSRAEISLEEVSHWGGGPESYEVPPLPAQVLLSALLRCEQEATPKATSVELSLPCLSHCDSLGSLKPQANLNPSSLHQPSVLSENRNTNPYPIHDATPHSGLVTSSATGTWSVADVTLISSNDKVQHCNFGDKKWSLLLIYTLVLCKHSFVSPWQPESSAKK